MSGNRPAFPRSTWYIGHPESASIHPLPGEPVRAGRFAATEFDSARGHIWGEVHDPNAWAMGGVAGHAGLFGSARDLAVFAQMLLNAGE